MGADYSDWSHRRMIAEVAKVDARQAEFAQLSQAFSAGAGKFIDFKEALDTSVALLQASWSSDGALAATQWSNEVAAWTDSNAAWANSSSGGASAMVAAIGAAKSKMDALGPPVNTSMASAMADAQAQSGSPPYDTLALTMLAAADHFQATVEDAQNKAHAAKILGELSDKGYDEFVAAPVWEPSGVSTAASIPVPAAGDSTGGGGSPRSVTVPVRHPDTTGSSTPPSSAEFVPVILTIWAPPTIDTGLTPVVTSDPPPTLTDGTTVGTDVGGTPDAAGVPSSPVGPPLSTLPTVVQPAMVVGGTSAIPSAASSSSVLLPVMPAVGPTAGVTPAVLAAGGALLAGASAGAGAGTGFGPNTGMVAGAGVAASSGPVPLGGNLPGGIGVSGRGLSGSAVGGTTAGGGGAYPTEGVVRTGGADAGPRAVGDPIASRSPGTGTVGRAGPPSDAQGQAGRPAAGAGHSERSAPARRSGPPMEAASSDVRAEQPGRTGSARTAPMRGPGESESNVRGPGSGRMVETSETSNRAGGGRMVETSEGSSRVGGVRSAGGSVDSGNRIGGGRSVGDAVESGRQGMSRNGFGRNGPDRTDSGQARTGVGNGRSGARGVDETRPGLARSESGRPGSAGRAYTTGAGAEEAPAEGPARSRDGRFGPTRAGRVGGSIDDEGRAARSRGLRAANSESLSDGDERSATQRGAAPTRSGSGRGFRGSRQPHDDEPELHHRPAYLLEIDDLWGECTRVSPPVLG